MRTAHTQNLAEGPQDLHQCRCWAEALAFSTPHSSATLPQSSLMPRLVKNRHDASCMLPLPLPGAALQHLQRCRPHDGLREAQLNRKVRQCGTGRHGAQRRSKRRCCACSQAASASRRLQRRQCGCSAGGAACGAGVAKAGAAHRSLALLLSLQEGEVVWGGGSRRLPCKLFCCARAEQLSASQRQVGPLQCWTAAAQRRRTRVPKS